MLVSALAMFALSWQITIVSLILVPLFLFTFGRILGAPHAEVVVLVDVLRFTTAVCAAIEAGATVLCETTVTELAQDAYGKAIGVRTDRAEVDVPVREHGDERAALHFFRQTVAHRRPFR